jgi:hypothetical protein
MSVMRAGILAHSLPSAVTIYREFASNTDVEIHVLLFAAPGESVIFHVLKHLFRAVARPGRLSSLKLIITGKVKLFLTPPDEPAAVDRISRLGLDIGLHQTGLIYRRSTIEAFRLGILNPHIGILPRYRGRSVLEWAVIEGGPIGVTVFFVDTGIDTGEQIVLREEVDISHCRSVDEAKSYLFGLAPSYFRRAVEQLRSSNEGLPIRNAGPGRRYFVVSKLFKQLADEHLAGN